MLRTLNGEIITYFFYLKDSNKEYFKPFTKKYIMLVSICRKNIPNHCYD